MAKETAAEKANARRVGKSVQRRRGGKEVNVKKAAKRGEKPEQSRTLPKRVPIWLRRLGLVKAEMKTVRFPRTAQEGFEQGLLLSANALRLLRDSLRKDHPGASEKRIDLEMRRLMARFSAADRRWGARWRKECDHYFRQ
jgi:hypothetical protein